MSEPWGQTRGGPRGTRRESAPDTTALQLLPSFRAAALRVRCWIETNVEDRSEKPRDPRASLAAAAGRPPESVQAGRVFPPTSVSLAKSELQMSSAIPEIIIWICDPPSLFSLEDRGLEMKNNICKGSGGGKVFAFAVTAANNAFSLTWCLAARNERNETRPLHVYTSPSAFCIRCCIFDSFHPR